MILYKKIRFLFFVLLVSIASLGYSQTVTISGTVTTPNGNPLNQVEITTTDGQYSTTTDADGNYSLEVATNNEYSLALVRNTDPREGISVRDMFKMRQHILGFSALGLWEELASDVNDSGGVTTFDVVLLRRLIVLNEPLPVASWQFYHDDGTGNLLLSPITINGTTDLLNFNIIGVKSGNLDCQ